MKILIVEDDKHKSSDIIEFIISQGIDKSSIYLTESIADTVTYLASTTPDKIVLDMSLPSHTAGSSIPLPNGGIEVLLELRYKGIIDLPVLILTQYPQIEINKQFYALNQSAKKIMSAFSMKNILVSDFDNEVIDQEGKDWVNYLQQFLSDK
jgi:CheY-like chemotaxis protein